MLVSVMLLSCKPDDEEGNNNHGGGNNNNNGGITGIYNPGKKISKIKSQTNYNGNNISDETHDWSWNGNVLESIEVMDLVVYGGTTYYIDNYMYTYDGLGRLVRIVVDGDTTDEDYSYIYKNGNLSEVHVYDDYECYAIYKLQYTNNKLSRVEETEYPEHETSYYYNYDITWQSDNIIAINCTDKDNPSSYRNFTFEYDDKINPFYDLLFDPSRWNFDVSYENIRPLCKNNRVKATVESGPGFEPNNTTKYYSYEYDNDGYPTSITTSTNNNTSFTYNIEYLGENDDNIEKPEKVILLENYTGVKCTNSADANDIAVELNEQYPDNLVILNIHAGALSAPQPGGFPNFQTDEGTAWYNYFYFYTSPIGTINRKLNDGSYAFYANEWADAVATVLQEEAQVDMILDIDFNNNSRELDVTVKSKFFTELPDTYNLVVCIVEDNIKGKQVTIQGNNPDYMHRYVFRETINGTWGEEINDGFIDIYDEFVKSYRTTLSNVYNADQCYIVAYIANNETKEILQVAQKKIK